jgi:L-lysine 6-transaminase
LRRLCEEFDVLLIFDEVQTGWGSTGKNWCAQHFDVLPDLLVFGKKAQVCGVMAGPRLDEVPDNCFRLSSRLNSTWGSHLVDMVRSTHYMRIIEQERLVENAAAMGGRLLAGLQALEEPMITAPRGRGLMVAFDLPDTEARDQFYRGLFDLGLLAIRCGEKSIRFRPALDIGEPEVERALELITEQAKRSRGGWRGRPGSVTLSAAAEPEDS